MYPELGDLKNQVLCHSSSDEFYLKRLIKERSFTHALQVIIPYTPRYQNPLKDFIKPYYLVRQIRLASLLDYEFLSAFVRSGNLSVLSAYSPDKENSMAITANGRLTLNLRPDTYYRLGLEGTEVNWLLRKRGMNLDLKKIEIDLCDPKFYPGSKIYDRVLECVDRCNLKYDILLHWTPPTPEISTASPMEFLVNRIDGLEWKECSCRYNSQQVPNVDVPNEFDKSFFDWAGVISAGGRINVQDNSTQRSLIVAQYTGFIPYESLQECARVLRRFAQETSFTVISSVGFQSDPTLTTQAVFNNESTLTICYKDNPVSYAVFSCPPPL